MQIVEYLAKCLCFKKIKLKKYKRGKARWNERYKHHVHFIEGEDKLFNELDVLYLLKQMRRVRLMSQIMLTQNQKILLNF